MSDLQEGTGQKDVKKFIEEESWLRQPGETNAAFHAFCLYRDYGGDRSIKKALEASSTPMSRSGIWQAWSKKNLWVKRAGDYDKHLDNIRRKERENSFREREKKHLAISKKMLDLIEKRLKTFDPEELSQGMMMEWLKNCVSIERESLDPEDGEGKHGTLKQMEISFFEEFNGV